MGIEEKKPVRSTKVLQKEAGIVQSQHPQTPEDEENEAGLEQDVPQRPAFSKARLIALVITVTGAAFLNADARSTSRYHRPPYHWQRPQHTRQPPAMDHLRLLSNLRMLPLALGKTGGCIWEALYIHMGLCLGYRNHNCYSVCEQRDWFRCS